MKESISNTLKTLNKYKVYIGAGIGVAIALGAGAVFFTTVKAQKADVAWQNISKINYDLAVAAQGKDDKERNAALNTAAEAYKYIRDNMPSTSATPWTLFQLGNIYYNLKNYDEAIRVYNDFLDRCSGHRLVPLVKQSLGYAYEEKGLLQEAVKQFEDISISNNFLAVQEGWDAGRCYEKLGQTNDAIRSYAKVIELSPNSNWATLAQYRLSVIR